MVSRFSSGRVAQCEAIVQHAHELITSMNDCDDDRRAKLLCNAIELQAGIKTSSGYKTTPAKQKRKHPQVVSSYSLCISPFASLHWGLVGGISMGALKNGFSGRADSP